MRIFTLIFVTALLNTGAALALPVMPVDGAVFAAQTQLQILQVSNEWPVKPSEAVKLAQDAMPGATVLSVKLLPDGEYAVTLKLDGEVLRVKVDATSGAVN